MLRASLLSAVAEDIVRKAKDCEWVRKNLKFRLNFVEMEENILTAVHEQHMTMAALLYLCFGMNQPGRLSCRPPRPVEAGSAHSNRSHRHAASSEKVLSVVVAAAAAPVHAPVPVPALALGDESCCSVRRYGSERVLIDLE